MISSVLNNTFLSCPGPCGGNQLCAVLVYNIWETICCPPPIGTTRIQVLFNNPFIHHRKPILLVLWKPILSYISRDVPIFMMFFIFNPTPHSSCYMIYNMTIVHSSTYPVLLDHSNNFAKQAGAELGFDYITLMFTNKPVNLVTYTYLHTSLLTCMLTYFPIYLPTKATKQSSTNSQFQPPKITH